MEPNWDFNERRQGQIPMGDVRYQGPNRRVAQTTHERQTHEPAPSGYAPVASSYATPSQPPHSFEKPQDVKTQNVQHSKEDLDEAAKKLVEARKHLAEAQAEHDKAKADHDAALEAARVKPEDGKHIMVMFPGTNDYVMRDHPVDKDLEGRNTLYKSRTLHVDGVHVEHVAEVENGVWAYRSM
jgi:hypothetical protein